MFCKSLQNLRELEIFIRKRIERMTITFEKLVHEFDPVETKGMQESGQGLQHHEHTDRGADEDGPDAEGDEEGHAKVHAEAELNQAERPEDSGELGVSEGQGPKTQVRRRVGDSTKDELDGLNDLVDEHLDELKVLAMASAVGSSGSVGGGFFIFLVQYSVGVVVLMSEDERLDEEHGGDGNKGDEDEDDLHDDLALVELERLHILVEDLSGRG